MAKKKTDTRTARREAQVQDKSVLVELDNPTLSNAFGDPFMLQNFRFDEELWRAVQKGESDEEVDEDDLRVQQLVHADLAYSIEYFLRARNAQTRDSLVVSSQTDADHIHDLGEALQVHRKGKEGAPLLISKSDHRWLLQKAKELAFKAFPVDSRMFIDLIDVATPKVDDGEGETDEEKK